MINDIGSNRFQKSANSVDLSISRPPLRDCLFDFLPAWIAHCGRNLQGLVSAVSGRMACRGDSVLDSSTYK